ncbi:MAG: type 1 glutamine amidotransferase [Rickettsiales bacterium]|jgi:GMP synthase-like glutamine amidotransferase|nr:type 1 glutamine amidotransferase [Rickettsiales bacterium]
MKIAVLQHVAFESAGMIADWAEVRDHSVTIYPLYENALLPSIDAFEMLVVMGGPMSVGDEADYSWLVPEKAFIKAAIEADKYVVGICLGAQLIANALGARVYPNRVKEIGWFPVAIVDEAIGQPILSGLNSAMNVFHWHGDTFDLPQGAHLLMSSAECKNQAFLYNQRVLGLQFHLEMTEVGIKSIIAHCKEDIVPSASIQPEEEILRSIGTIAPCKRILNSMLDQITLPV